jgi:geranylgeranyl diphosphate synthase type II
MIDQYLSHINDYVEKHPFTKRPERLYEPLDYILSLGGKRIRPVLTLMACEMMNGSIEEALPAAYAIEIFHNFSLIHDDIMDCAPLRRGKETVHTKYDVNTGILSGDAMLIYAYQYLAKYQDALVPAMVRNFTETSILVCEGQQLDMDFEQRSDVDIPEYIEMITNKTAVLLAEALRMGALVAGASDHALQHFYDFGRNVGIAFQMQDDILDTYGENHKVGKQKGGDIIQGKKTYLYLKALELSTADQRTYLESLYEDQEMDKQEKVTKVMEIFDELHVRVYADQVKEAYRDLAYSHLDTIDTGGNDTTILRQLAQYLLDRDK